MHAYIHTLAQELSSLKRSTSKKEMPARLRQRGMPHALSFFAVLLDEPIENLKSIDDFLTLQAPKSQQPNQKKRNNNKANKEIHNNSQENRTKWGIHIAKFSLGS